MARGGTTWKVYGQLLQQIASLHNQTLTVQSAPVTQEEDLLKAFSADLKSGNDASLAILKAANIGEQQFRYHLRYIARWSAQRRQLLADGGNFQLLEGLSKLEKDGLLDGLQLRGSRAQQVRQLSDHTRQLLPVPSGSGWLAPMQGTTRKAQVYDDRQVVWLYPAGEVDFLEGLHPYVARSLIARYVPTQGIVADPMAGDGVVPQMAIQLGHTAWASDIAPARPYVRQLDLLDGKLSVIFGEEHRAAADLLVMHPPLPETLEISDPGYTDWLESILDNCWGAVKAGGHLALIVPVTVSVPVFARAERALTDSASEMFGQDIEVPTHTHLAVSRDGKEGWHILVYRTPAIEEVAE
ncbi:hypothetical protein [Deinococcus sp.]|uniref:hypothetical protein n=1 Tax=Deinococcus sp. TaxID=47478 RepID=UPI003C7DFA38